MNRRMPLTIGDLLGYAGAPDIRYVRTYTTTPVRRCTHRARRYNMNPVSKQTCPYFYYAYAMITNSLSLLKFRSLHESRISLSRIWRLVDDRR